MTDFKRRGGQEVEKLQEFSPEQIISRDKFNSNLTFALENETDEDGNEINCQAFWVSFEDDGKKAEGKLFVPKEGVGEKLIIFEPGMPGNSTIWMDQRHAPKLVKEGYTVLILRHLGTRMTDEKAKKEYLGCDERVEKGKKVMGNEEFLGVEGECDVEAMSHEVSTAVNNIAQNFKEVNLIGHSSGSLNVLYDFDNIKPEVQGKIKRVVSMEGFVHKALMDLKEKMTLEDFYAYCNGVLNIGSAERNVNKAEEMFSHIENQGKDLLPKETTFIQMHVAEDDYFLLGPIKDLQDKLGRGITVVNETQLDEKDEVPTEPHDLGDLKTEDLLQFLTISGPELNETWKLTPYHEDYHKK